MPRRLNLPDTASVAQAREGGKLCAPSALRNIGPICDLVGEHAPDGGTALEIASGTGQHIAALAKRFPALTWQPTDIDAARLASIDAWVGDAGLCNVAPAMALDACAPGWAAAQGGNALILCVNLLHLISESETLVLITEAARALAPGGLLILYGPFLRDGETTSDGDAKFHASLIKQDPEIGYKDDFDVIEWLHAAWLELVQVVEMPANNLSFVARKP